MKKIFSALISVVLVAALTVSSAFAASFSDVPASGGFSKEINALADEGIINGFSDGTFRPKQEVTRGQAAILIGRALGLDGTKRATPFSDVGALNTASGYIASAVAADVIAGYPDGTYRPSQSITRGQLAIMIGRAFKIKETASISFTDVSRHSAAYPFIENMVAAGISNGYTNKLYRPGVAVPREQFAAFLYRAYIYDPGSQQNVDWSRYFLKTGQQASFLGDGNEYATYVTRTVWHDSRHVTVYTDNGGTVMAQTYRLEANKVSVVREEGEQYTDYKPTSSQLNALKPIYTYLQAPLTTGAVFEDWEVIDDNAVLFTPLRTFNNVVVLESVDEENETILRVYFAERYGEVKVEFDGDDYSVTSVIEKIN